MKCIVMRCQRPDKAANGKLYVPNNVEKQIMQFFASASTAVTPTHMHGRCDCNLRTQTVDV